MSLRVPSEIQGVLGLGPSSFKWALPASRTTRPNKSQASWTGRSNQPGGSPRLTMSAKACLLSSEAR
eukprot:8960803-Alexandrium_andersonii.AAC.1